jgi:hypothetical protein
MTQSPESSGVPPMITDERELAWMEEHLPELKQSVAGPRILYWSLGISFVVGLAAHVGGYALLSSARSGLIGLLADLLHALGWSLWTGAVVAVFIQIIPEAKRRQIGRAVDAYEALQREKFQATDKRDGAVVERPRARRAERAQDQMRSRDRTRKEGG